MHELDAAMIKLVDCEDVIVK